MSEEPEFTIDIDDDEPDARSWDHPPRVLFFSGKGGVGKTTLAGTASLRLAQEGDQVLVASTDPAHSLSDLFDAPIGSQAVSVASGVEAVEVDAPSAIQNMVDNLGPLSESDSVNAAADMLKMVSHAPGIDEIISLDLLLRLVEDPSCDDVVLDTAPTGHTLRLLALPDLMDRYFGRMLKWRGRMSRISRRLRRLFRAGDLPEGEDLGEELAGARGRMRMLADLLRDPERCALFLVTIPEAMSVLETSRTLEILQEQGMTVTAVAVNMLQPAQPDCPFCTARRDAQMVQLERIHELVRGVPLLMVEHEVHEPRGAQKLAELAAKVWQEEAEGLLLG